MANILPVVLENKPGLCLTEACVRLRLLCSVQHCFIILFQGGEMQNRYFQRHLQRLTLMCVCRSVSGSEKINSALRALCCSFFRIKMFGCFICWDFVTSLQLQWRFLWADQPMCSLSHCKQFKGILPFKLELVCVAVWLWPILHIQNPSQYI